MKTSLKIGPSLSALVLSLAGCSAAGTSQGAPHLSATQCADLTAIRNGAPPTRGQNLSQLAALRAAGYDPSIRFDPHYPEDLHAAQRQVDLWYQAECQPARAE
ncbi:DUF4148 domain-containing protein [Paraburkholderia metrosideri]|jgi:hypothetical protein|uniref:DUF4148 domain-containing protein n=1 Tax=Paraburkholderia metrosideri TaxID=580937 RepID=A0ABM8P209_9BURK|nr:DUF4148 domain-containing protein [Paraburkholderia metrosideri]CAD6553917.1 hypothetical protein LMG28140_05398 [Paraburkholderia metrosideri]